MENNGIKVNVYPSDILCVTYQRKQFKFPKTRKMRIRKKWRKDERNFKVIENHKMARIGNDVFLSKKQYDQYITSIS